MDEIHFIRLAETLLEALFEQIDEQIGDAVEVDLLQGILTLVLFDERRYIINKHAVNQQIWVASPISGAWHFAYQNGQWQESSRGEQLIVLLARELTEITKTALTLIDPARIDPETMT